ncbi:hypothetical protein ACVNF4_21310, partial [Streptomyces sp. S6]
MTDQQGPYDPYARQWPQQGQQGRQSYDALDDDTQQWQGETWETSVQPSLQMPSPAEETAYLPPQPAGPYATDASAPSPYAWQQPAPGAAQANPYTSGGGTSGAYAPADGTGAYAAGTGGFATGETSARAAGPYASPDASSGSFATNGAYAGVPAGTFPPAAGSQEAAYDAPDTSTGGFAHAGAPDDRFAPPAQAGAAVADQPSTPAPGYGPATLAGNARITDAQRARLEGRSPVIEPGMQPAALTALLGLLLAGTAPLGVYGLLLPLVALQAVTAAGWFRLNGMWPARQGIALAFLGALVADAVLLGVGTEHAPAAILGTLGVWVLLCLILQLRSHADPDERMYGLMATVTSSALAIVATGFLGADSDAVSVGAAAVAVAILARALPLPTPASVIVSLLA